MWRRYKYWAWAVVYFSTFSTAWAAEGDIPSGKWWRLPKASERLSLTDQEKSNLDDLFVNSRRALIDLKSAVEKERFELENLMDQPTLDEKAVTDQFRKLEKARTDLAQERFRFLLGVRKILGFDRHQQIKTWYQERRRERRDHQGEFRERRPPRNG